MREVFGTDLALGLISKDDGTCIAFDAFKNGDVWYASDLSHSLLDTD